jgi:hypothetical protein
VVSTQDQQALDQSLADIQTDLSAVDPAGVAGEADVPSN